MRRDRVARGIINSWRIVDDLGIGESLSTPQPLGVVEELRRLALDPSTRLSELYIKINELRQYNFITKDHGVFQFSIFGENLRYAYCPNPFVDERGTSITKLKGYLEEGIIDEETYTQILESKPVDSRVPLIRYEYAPEQYVPVSHPCAHLHIGHQNEGRCPVDKEWTPEVFTCFVVKHFYHDEWHEWEGYPEGDYNNIFENRMAKEVNGCTVLDRQKFSTYEDALLKIN
jgi:hypothetical protein